MFEKVNPAHPDKVADRIAGAIVDACYRMAEAPHVAVEVLVGHGDATVMVETDTPLNDRDVRSAALRLLGRGTNVRAIIVPQDEHLNGNQRGAVRCGDNGIFKGMPITDEQRALSSFMRDLYNDFPTDGKGIIQDGEIVLCQSNMTDDDMTRWLLTRPSGEPRVRSVNPLGEWSGGTDVDAGATNRKLGSDMGDAVTGGGLHGKDLSKADVTVNIYCHVMAQLTGKPYSVACAIGDETVDGHPYADLVAMARTYIRAVGGFEKFAEWGLI